MPRYARARLRRTEQLVLVVLLLPELLVLLVVAAALVGLGHRDELRRRRH